MTFDLDLDLEHILDVGSSEDHRVQVWWRSSHFCGRRSDLRKVYRRTDGRTDGRRTPSDCISSWNELKIVQCFLLGYQEGLPASKNLLKPSPNVLQVMVTPENATCEVYNEYVKQEKTHSMKISYKFIKATDNKGAFMQITETLGQEKISRQCLSRR